MYIALTLWRRSGVLPPLEFIMAHVRGKFVSDTEKAILISVKGQEHWVPKSQIKTSLRQGDDMEMDIPDWLAEKAGIWYD